MSSLAIIFAAWGALGVLAAIVMALARTGPDEARSNLSKWAETFGIPEVPSWLRMRSADRLAFRGAATAMVLLVGLAAGFWAGAYAGLLKTAPLSSGAPMPQRNIGPNNITNAISAAGDLWNHLSPGTAILFTNDDRANDDALRIIQGTMIDGARTFKTGPVGRVLPAPDYQKNVDAPRIPKTNERGVIIHGAEHVVDIRDQYTNIRFKNALSCFVVMFVPGNLDDLAAYYQVPKVLWIEIGSGSPWRAPRGAERETCAD